MSGIAPDQDRNAVWLAAAPEGFVAAVRTERVRRQELELSHRSALLLRDSDLRGLRGDLVQRAAGIL